jgi:hypothetical protein
VSPSPLTVEDTLCLPAEADSRRRALLVLRSRANSAGGCALLFCCLKALWAAPLSYLVRFALCALPFAYFIRCLKALWAAPQAQVV